MNARSLLAAGACALVLLAASPLAALVAGQGAGQGANTAPAYAPPRTPWGDPDIQGVYNYQDMVPLERPVEFTGRTMVTRPELEKWFKARGGYFSGDWNPMWFVNDNRTSLITDPADGRIPLTEDGRRRYMALEEYRRVHQHAFDTWAETGSRLRCISSAVPRLLGGYNNGAQIFQSPGYVVIIYEQLDTRIIPLSGQPTLDANVRQWNGDARGRWEGNTLVVETTNFTDKEGGWPPMRDQGGVEDQLGHSGVPRGNLKLTERFMPVSATRMEYTVTNVDPTWFSRPWTFMLPWEKDTENELYEYACNEGNISFEGALKGARVKELSGEPYQPPAVIPGGERRLPPPAAAPPAQR